SDDRANAVAVGADGTVVLAGSWDGGESDFAVARLTAAGKLDPTFGGGVFPATSGKTDVFFGDNFLSGAEFATGVAALPDGRVVVGGYTNLNSAANNQFAVARLNKGGSLDTTFNATGKQTVSFGGDDKAYGLAVQA